jgi:hypothetical protein
MRTGNTAFSFVQRKGSGSDIHVCSLILPLPLHSYKQNKTTRSLTSCFVRMVVPSTMPLRGREEDVTSHIKRKSGRSMRRNEGSSQHNTLHWFFFEQHRSPCSFLPEDLHELASRSALPTLEHRSWCLPTKDEHALRSGRL